MKRDISREQRDWPAPRSAQGGARQVRVDRHLEMASGLLTIRLVEPRSRVYPIARSHAPIAARAAVIGSLPRR